MKKDKSEKQREAAERRKRRKEEKRGSGKRESRKSFWFSLSLSLALFLIAAGFLKVDAEGRRLSFGDDTPPFQTVDAGNGKTDLEIHLFGADRRVDITKIYDFWIFLLDFSCIPHK